MSERMSEELVQDWCATVGRLWPRVPYLTSDARDELLRARAAEEALAAELASAKASNERLLDLLAGVEYASNAPPPSHDASCCPFCGQYVGWGHYEDCEWAAAMKDGGREENMNTTPVVHLDVEVIPLEWVEVCPGRWQAAWTGAQGFVSGAVWLNQARTHWEGEVRINGNLYVVPPQKTLNAIMDAAAPRVLVRPIKDMER